MSKSVKKQVGAGKSAQTVEKNPQKPAKKGKTPSQLMNRQVHDKGAVITDEEFKELNIEVTLEDEIAHKPLDIPNDQDRPKDEDKDHAIVTPWDVLKE